MDEGQVTRIQGGKYAAWGKAIWLGRMGGRIEVMTSRISGDRSGWRPGGNEAKEGSGRKETREHRIWTGRKGLLTHSGWKKTLYGVRGGRRLGRICHYDTRHIW